MIVGSKLIGKNKADTQQDCSLGNIFFRIASTIGIAKKNGYDFAFYEWPNQEYFINPLPKTNNQFKTYRMPVNFTGLDFGFTTFDVPDNREVDGELGSFKYFDHCKDLVRHYLTMKPLCDPFEDCILVHYRDYKGNPAFTQLGKSYYKKALKKMPEKRVVVVTDNIDSAFKELGPSYEYTSNIPIIDFYLLSHTDHLVMANSTFSWWASWMSRAFTIAPKNWYAGSLKDAPTKDLYLPHHIVL